MPVQAGKTEDEEVQMRIMKALLIAVFSLAVVTTMGWAKAPKSAIVDSPHDLRATFQSASYTLCSFCHVAHKTGAAPEGPGYLLWNHTLSSVTTYGVYQSDSMKATDLTDLGGQLTVSNLCLSCHDGTVAVNSFYEPVGNATFDGNIPEDTTFVGNAIIRDLSKTHPVNFTYNATVANAAGMLVPASSSSVDAAGEIPLFNSKMQCVTCHDPHNGESGIFEQNFPTQASGSFCTYCHL
jgi:hypothetical protein